MNTCQWSELLVYYSAGGCCSAGSIIRKTSRQVHKLYRGNEIFQVWLTSCHNYQEGSGNCTRCRWGMVALDFGMGYKVMVCCSTAFESPVLSMDIHAFVSPATFCVHVNSCPYLKVFDNAKGACIRIGHNYNRAWCTLCTSCLIQFSEISVQESIAALRKFTACREPSASSNRQQPW